MPPKKTVRAAMPPAYNILQLQSKIVSLQEEVQITRHENEILRGKIKNLSLKDNEKKVEFAWESIFGSRYDEQAASTSDTSDPLQHRLQSDHGNTDVSSCEDEDGETDGASYDSEGSCDFRASEDLPEADGQPRPVESGGAQNIKRRIKIDR